MVNEVSSIMFPHSNIRYPYVGSTGYVVIGASHDCLFENIYAHRLRHAPDIQSGATGNVVRRCRFEWCNPEAHQGQSYENLLEGNYFNTENTLLWWHPNITYGVWNADTGSAYRGIHCEVGELHGHTPGCGPRWVAYNNDVLSPREGLSLGGQNENFIAKYNRFYSYGNSEYGGPGIEMREQSFDHIIEGNVFSIRSVEVIPGQPNVAVRFVPRETGQPISAQQNCRIDFNKNKIYLTTRTLTNAENNGSAQFEEVNGNTWEDYDPIPLMPIPDVPSIFAYQRGWPSAVIKTPGKLTIR